MLRFLFAIFLFLLISTAAQARTVKVLDGDTIVTNRGEHVRLYGIDAPEIHRTGRDPYKCGQELQLGLKAKARMQELLTGQNYRIVNDHYKGKKRKDLYGRTLGGIHVNGKDVGTTLISEGLAKPWNGQHATKPDWCS